MGKFKPTARKETCLKLAIWWQRIWEQIQTTLILSPFPNCYTKQKNDPVCNSQFHHDVTIFLVTEQGGTGTILIKKKAFSSPQSLDAWELGGLEINYRVGSGASE